MIEIDRRKLFEIESDLDKLGRKVPENNTYYSLKKKIRTGVTNVLSSEESRKVVKDIAKITSIDNFTFQDVTGFYEALDTIHQSMKEIKQDIDLDVFLKKGQTLDIEKIKAKFKSKDLKKKYPQFDFKRLKELYEKPPQKLITYYNDQEMKVDEFVFRKYLVGLVQMVLDHMDLVTAVTGGEGTGKSTHVSQLMYMVYWMIHELKIVEYKFDITKTFFSNLESFRLTEDDLFEQPFRILTLDEGNELHRQNWKDEEVNTFFQRLRRERFNQRIKFICIPVLGELISNVVLTRVNFIVEMANKNDVKTGSLNKGRVNFYIVPRGDKVYSPFLKKDLTRGFVKTTLYETLKDKNYLKGIPEDILIHRYECNGTWGFPQELYEKELKETNKSFKVAGGLKLTDTEAFYLYTMKFTLKKLGILHTDPRYKTMAKFVSRLNSFWEDDINRLEKFERIYERKSEEKRIKVQEKELAKSKSIPL